MQNKFSSFLFELLRNIDGLPIKLQYKDSVSVMVLAQVCANCG
ncbi:hypothetical protein [Ralstonia solanacearum]|uniref:Uncharacterized protein n=1 Tax=Ralstonia solanacearum (strain Po82) TaxID=1031711 RepID=F6G1M3_RALS8|nr:hypothetical protein [Ralstonia solanacearum]AEG69156.1 hypothetical protein RSPO_c01856 [Ralstonia solanacearum Po82]MDC6180198.1 hypothetical protein [Ralstonia solanacearum]MDC6212954.1 hypothetical protein [Ralstonia solanacearum]MDC6241610.1 hypothetical protein [Ralstonia solanacearum]MDC6317734.1 hypothetical protein [Ralstonia solanacearum]